VADTLPAKVACVAGVIMATTLWFLFLSRQVSRSHGKFSEKTLLRMQHISGLCLLLTALYDGGLIVWHLAKHPHQP